MGIAVRFTEEYGRGSGNTGGHTAFSRLHQSHCDNPLDFNKNLQSILLLPYFFKPPLSSGHLQLIDASGVLQNLSKITEFADKMIADPAGADIADLWSNGNVLYLSLCNLQVYSSSDSRLTEYPSPKIVCEWSPLVATLLLYLCSCLAVFDIQTLYGCKIQRYLVYLVRSDISETKTSLYHWDQKHQRLWLWKVFNAAISLDIPSATKKNDLSSLKEEFGDCLAYWSEVTGTKLWADVTAALKSLTWPENEHVETRAKAIWSEALSRERGML